ncbi:MAG: enoyl-CoA hydratase/isomerase family protein [Gammaproteobacteria bacterium]|nr:enoyl-CoA hydratase/isomerase family protein [Gammaproteobacteria bacterium]
MTDEQPQRPVYWQIDDNGIATVRINRARRLNALNLEVKRLLEAAITALGENSAVRVIVLTGDNDVFVAGTDIAEMRDMTSSTHADLNTGRVFEVLRTCPKPLIAAVERYALGGGFELALACDLIIASDEAKFAQPEIRVGIMPGAGGTQILLRTAGRYRALKLLLTGEQIGAAEALSCGLVSEVVPAGTTYAAALALAQTIVGMPPLAVAAIRQVVRQGQDLPLTAALQLERTAFTALFDSADQVEGMQAFLDKRKPDYRGC